MKRTILAAFFGIVACAAVAFPAEAAVVQNGDGTCSFTDAPATSSANTWRPSGDTQGVYYYYGAAGEFTYALMIGDGVQGRAANGALLFDFKPAADVDGARLIQAAHRTMTWWPNILNHYNRINAERAAIGLYPLRLDLDLCVIAAYRSDECINIGFRHYDDAGNFEYQKITAKYLHNLPLAENLSWTYSNHMTAQAQIDKLFQLLRESPVHYSNMICDYEYSVGIGFFEEQGGDHRYVTTELFSYDSGLFHYNPASGVRE